MRLYSYVVRYDSGFAPNPFYGWCTLATCKPYIRRTAQVGDWLVGTGSDSQQVQRGGYLVYAMRVGEIMTFEAYDADPRFQAKKPYRHGSRKQSCGDSIYYRDAANRQWLQRDSFHSNVDGSRRADHVQRDTGVNRVLVSNTFVYFGGAGPKIPTELRAADGRPLSKAGIGYYAFDDPAFIARVETWLMSLGAQGYQSPPFEWISLRD
ncbi:Nmad2 family putative nucleotide modification protein [Rhodanobacter sp. UC4436_H3]